MLRDSGRKMLGSQGAASSLAAPKTHTNSCEPQLPALHLSLCPSVCKPGPGLAQRAPFTSPVATGPQSHPQPRGDSGDMVGLCASKPW